MSTAEALAALIVVLGFVCAIVGGALIWGGGGALVAVAVFLIYVGRTIDSVTSQPGSGSDGDGGLSVYRRGE